MTAIFPPHIQDSIAISNHAEWVLQPEIGLNHHPRATLAAAHNCRILATTRAAQHPGEYHDLRAALFAIAGYGLTGHHELALKVTKEHDVPQRFNEPGIRAALAVMVPDADHPPTAPSWQACIDALDDPGLDCEDLTSLWWHRSYTDRNVLQDMAVRWAMAILRLRREKTGPPTDQQAMCYHRLWVEPPNESNQQRWLIRSDHSHAGTLSIPVWPAHDAQINQYADRRSSSEFIEQCKELSRFMKTAPTPCVKCRRDLREDESCSNRSCPNFEPCEDLDCPVCWTQCNYCSYASGHTDGSCSVEDCPSHDPWLITAMETVTGPPWFVKAFDVTGPPWFTKPFRDRRDWTIS